MIQIDPGILPYFRKAGTVHNFSAGEIVYLQGDRAPKLYLILTGRVRMFFTKEDGKEITFQIIGQGQLFGASAFLGQATRPATISAVVDTTLLSCEVGQLLPYMSRSPALSTTLLQLLTDNYHFLCNQIKRLSLYDRRQKIASYLLEQTADPNPGLGIEHDILPYTHEELGVCLNLNRVTVTNVLTEFQKRGYVRLGRKKIQIIDRSGLERIVDPQG